MSVNSITVSINKKMPGELPTVLILQNFSVNVHMLPQNVMMLGLVLMLNKSLSLTYKKTITTITELLNLLTVFKVITTIGYSLNVIPILTELLMLVKSTLVSSNLKTNGEKPTVQFITPSIVIVHLTEWNVWVTGIVNLSMMSPPTTYLSMMKTMMELFLLKMILMPSI